MGLTQEPETHVPALVVVLGPWFVIPPMAGAEAEHKSQPCSEGNTVYGELKALWILTAAFPSAPG